MTKFTAYYNLCPIHDPKEFLGISQDQNEGNIITTLDKNIIIIIKISTQKQIRSWSVTEKLSTKVVFDRQSQRYIGVFGSRSLRCWDEACEDVNKVKKLKFTKSIADLVVLDDKTFVLYNDGSCELLSKAIKARKEQPDESLNLSIPGTPSIYDAKAFKLPNGVDVLTYFDRQPAGEGLCLVRLYLENESGCKMTRFKVSRQCQPHYELIPTGYAVVEGEETLILMTIWSDNHIYMLKLDDNSESVSSPGKFVSRMSALRVDTQMAVLGISRNFVAIYGANNGQEGASLLLYNTKFQVIKTKQFFKVYLDYSRLWTVNQYILLAMGQNLSVVSYSKSPDLISDLLGTQSSNSFNSVIECDHINEDEPLQNHIHFADIETVSEIYPEEDKNEIRTISDNDFADGQKLPYRSVDDFNKSLSLLNKLELSVKVVEVERALEDIQISVMSNYYDNGFITPEVEQIAQQIESCGASECEITEKLLTMLITANLLEDIVVCLRRYTNVSDKMLAKVLKYAISQRSIEENSNKEIKVLSYQLSQPVKNVLDAVFTCNFNTESIAAQLRREIDYDSVVILMDYLYNLLEENSDATYPTRPTPLGNINDSLQFEMQILRWFSVLLSSHFQKLALSKDVLLMELLSKWHELCSRYQSLVQDMSETAAILYNIVAKKELSKETKSKWYSIEEVCLW